MECVACGGAAISERPERTAQGYRRFRCRDCGMQFNERTGGSLNRTQYPSDVIALVVFWRLRYKLSLRDLPEMFLLRGIEFTYEAVRDWEAKLTPSLIDNLRRRRAPRRLSIAGARALAVQLRAAVDTRHGALCAWVGRNRGCPLDLHALVPIPPAILRRGPDDPVSLAWLWEHWGTTWVLRHVRELPTRPGRRRGLARFRVEFYSADWTPWRALTAMRARWPSLRFEVWPDYASDPAPSDVLNG